MWKLYEIGITVSLFLEAQHIPSRELTAIPALLKMIFLLPRCDMLVSRGLHMYILRKQYLSIPSQNCAGLPTTRRSEYQETIELI